METRCVGFNREEEEEKEREEEEEQEEQEEEQEEKERKRKEGPAKRHKKWKPIDRQELLTFFAI